VYVSDFLICAAAKRRFARSRKLNASGVKVHWTHAVSSVNAPQARSAFRCRAASQTLGHSRRSRAKRDIITDGKAPMNRSVYFGIYQSMFSEVNGKRLRGGA